MHRVLALQHPVQLSLVLLGRRSAVTSLTHPPDSAGGGHPGSALDAEHHRVDGRTDMTGMDAVIVPLFQAIDLDVWQLTLTHADSA